MEINTVTAEYSENYENYVTQKSDSVFDIKNYLAQIIENIVSPKETLSLNEQINEKFLQLDFGSEFDVDASKIGVNDAIFFVNLLNQNNIINYSVEDKINLSLDDKKSLNVTNSLLNMLNTSYETKKPIRLDFDKDVTVILKLDKDGKVQAHFIPGNIEVENYLKSNIPSLKQRFDDQQINYSYLGYSKNPKKQKRSSK